MADYRESIATGKTWQRCKSITIDNTRGSVPSVIFTEEAVVELGGLTVGSHAGYCSATFDPQNGSIPLLDMATGEPDGTAVSHAELYQILFSLYMATAQARDAQS